MGDTGEGTRFTVVDTPGFGDRLIEEEKTIESLVQVTTIIIECIISINFGREAHPSFVFICHLILFQTLRDEIKYINVFVIAFKETDKRMTFALRSMISLFKKMFGDRFWDNAILEVLYRAIEHTLSEKEV